MTMVENGRSHESVASAQSLDPFSEMFEATQEVTPPTLAASGFTAWTETLSPFGEGLEGEAVLGEQDRLIAAAFAELRDETFDEAVAYLAEETEQAVGERFTDEAPGSGAERERFAESHLSGLRFESEQYLERLEAGLSGTDIASLSESQLDELLDQFDPPQAEVTPAGEEFIGALIRKAKKAVKFVANAAKGAVKFAGKLAGGLLGPILGRLKALINPLLRRVLAFAIGRLPAPLRPAARALATRFTSENIDENEANEENEENEEGAVSPANLSDPEAIGEQFDAALAEAIGAGAAGQLENETLESSLAEESDGRELETLAEARRTLLDQIRSAQDEENLGPVVEQFIPALLGALRLGINLVGRPKVVNFLAGYLGSLIRRWVGPNLSGPLSQAIVDTGLRLVTLEAESPEAYPGEAAHLAIGGVIEDTVRRVAENEEYVFENEELLQLATAEAFSRAVATHFPPVLLKPRLQQAPSLGGAFVTRRPRSIRPYRKYTRIPDVEITTQIADSLPTFGGVTVGAVLRAAGARLPLRARLHLYEATIGTTLPRLVRLDRSLGGHARVERIHPLTPEAAGLLLREPGLGVRVPDGFLRSRHRVAAGQRFYVIEPLDASAALALGATVGPMTRAALRRLEVTRSWTTIDRRRSRVVVGIYLSEAEAQEVAAAIRQGRGPAALLQAIVAAYRTRPGGLARRHFRRRLRGWALGALARWARTGAEAFARAAADPASGVTVRVEMSAVPGLDSAPGIGITGAIPVASAIRGTPSVAVTVTAGRLAR